MFHFPIGAVGIKRLQGKHYLSLVFQMMIVVGVNKLFLSESKTIKLHTTIMSVIKVNYYLKKLSYTNNDLNELDKLINILMKNLKDIFGEFQPSNFKFVKFHKLLHYTNSIRLFGSPSAYDSGLKNYFVN